MKTLLTTILFFLLTLNTAQGVTRFDISTDATGKTTVAILSSGTAAPHGFLVSWMDNKNAVHEQLLAVPPDKSPVGFSVVDSSMRVMFTVRPVYWVDGNAMLFLAPSDPESQRPLSVGYNKSGTVDPSPTFRLVSTNTVAIPAFRKHLLVFTQITDMGGVINLYTPDVYLVSTANFTADGRNSSTSIGSPVCTVVGIGGTAKNGRDSLSLSQACQLVSVPLESTRSRHTAYTTMPLKAITANMYYQDVKTGARYYSSFGPWFVVE